MIRLESVEVNFQGRAESNPNITSTDNSGEVSDRDDVMKSNPFLSSHNNKKSSFKTTRSEGLFSNEMTREENDLSLESDKNWKKE